MTSIYSTLSLSTINDLRKLQGRPPVDEVTDDFTELDDLDAEVDAEVDDQVTRLALPTMEQVRSNDQKRWESVMATGMETRINPKYLEASFKARVSEEHPDDRQRREFEEKLGLRQAQAVRKERNPEYAAAEAAATKVILNASKGVLLADLFNLLDPQAFITQAVASKKIGTTPVAGWAALRAISNLGRTMLRSWALSEMTLDQAQEVDTYLQALNALLPEDYAVAVTQWDRDEQEFKPVSCSYLVRQRQPINRGSDVTEVSLR